MPKRPRNFINGLVTFVLDEFQHASADGLLYTLVSLGPPERPDGDRCEGLAGAPSGELGVMSGVFLSYCRADAALADRVNRGLRALGVQVWWDQDMSAVDWQRELARQINVLAAVIVVWTPQSIERKSVWDEARLALDTDKLLNVLDGVSRPPFPFDRINGISLQGWTGREPHADWRKLVGAVEAAVVRVGGARPGAITGALAAHEQAIQSRRRAVVAAEAASEAASTGVADAAKAESTALAALARANEQLRRIVEFGATSPVRHAAQAEVDAASAALDLAAQNGRTAAARLRDATSAVSQAKAELEALFLQVAEPTADELKGGKAGKAPGDGARSADANPRTASGRADETIHPAHEGSRNKPGNTSSPPRDDPANAPKKNRLIPSLLIAGAAVALVVFLASHENERGQSASAAADAAAPAAPAEPPATAAAASPSLDAALKLASAMTGSWAPALLTCKDAIQVSLDGDKITVSGGGAHSVEGSIVDSSGDGSIEAKTPSGAISFKINGNNIFYTREDGKTIEASKCDV